MMKNFLIVIVALFVISGIPCSAQVTFVVETLPAYTPQGDFLYIAGDFNGWNPGASENILHKNDQDKWTITLPQQPAGTNMLYKFTRGSWETVEKGAGGEEIANRTFTFGNGETVNVVILNWADNGGGATSTASENVAVMDEDFFIPQLNLTRRIWIYLPPGYETSGIDYPVLYMHDGQNLFDVLTSYSGEWEVDETLNSLALQGFNVPIVVGIDNGGSNRIDEYTPWSNQQYGGGEGELYVHFITETLKPYVDQNYRTFSDRNNTALMGSSLGGLISHFGALQYQDVFSKVGIFSPSYWFSDSVWSFTSQTGKQQEMKFYQLCGTLEGGNTVSDMLRMNDTLVKSGFQQSEIFNKVVTGGQHNEELWRTNFSEAFLWMFGHGSSEIGEHPEKSIVICFPNPVEDQLSFLGLPLSEFDSIVISNVIGQPVKYFSVFIENKISVSDLKSGIYFIRFHKADVVIEGKFVKN